MNKLSKIQLEQLKQCLAETETQLHKYLNLDEVAAETVELDQSKVGRLSRLDALQQQAMAQASSEAHRQQLSRVHRAFQKINEGEYGCCEDCGKPIPFARLQIQPESELCVECLQALEDAS
ncbi:MAG: TraR/DksA family transcriptional regulator [Pseudomonadales bacterium]